MSSTGVLANGMISYDCYESKKNFNLQLYCTTGNISVTGIDFRMMRETKQCLDKSKCCPDFTSDSLCNKKLDSLDNFLTRMASSCRSNQECTIAKSFMPDLPADFTSCTENRAKNFKTRDIILIKFDCLTKSLSGTICIRQIYV